MADHVDSGSLNSGARIDAPSIPNATLLGEIIWLLGYSDLHQSWPIGSIRQWVIPALHHNQFRLYRRDGRPRGYVSWAWMSKDVEQRYVLDTPSFRLEDWKSGEHAWIIDFVAPFGDAREILRDLKYNLFADEVGRYLRVRPGSKTMQIRYAHGVNARTKARNPKYNPPVILE